MTNETFDVHITFTDGSSHKEPSKDMKGVESSLYRLLRGPACGMVSEVKVVDQLDLTVFHSKDGQILFPGR